MSKGKKKYAQVGALIWQSKFDDNGQRIEGEYKTDAQGRKLYSIKLDNKTKITIDGVDMTGKTLYVTRTQEALDRKLQNGIIQQEEYDKKIEEYGKDGRLEFIQFEISAKLD